MKPHQLHVLPCTLLTMLLLGGCVGDGSSSSAGQDEQDKPAKTYGGLPGHTCAVLVWTDFRTANEYATLNIDLARMLQNRLIARTGGQANDPKKPSSIQFINPASVLRYKRDHLEAETLHITELAPRLGVGRVVYVEIESFEAQSPDSIMVLRGIALATLRVVAVADGKGTIVFEEPGIKAAFPPNAPEGVVESDKYNPRTIYTGTLNQLADRLAARFEAK